MPLKDFGNARQGTKLTDLTLDSPLTRNGVAYQGKGESMINFTRSHFYRYCVVLAGAIHPRMSRRRGALDRGLTNLYTFLLKAVF